MSVIKVTENWKSLGVESQAGIETNTGSFTRSFDVVFGVGDTPIDRPIIALTANDGSTAIPDIWDTHPTYTDYYVQRKSVRPANGPLHYEVTLTYDYVESPLLQTPESSWTFATSSEPFDRDNANNPVTNSADEPFDPPPTREIHDLVFRHVRNEATFSSTIAAAYKGSVNSDTWNGWSPGTVQCTVFDAEEKRAGALTYYRVTYEFKFRPDGFGRRFLDHGYREKIGIDTNGKPIYANITDEEGSTVTQPALLDGKGKKLASGGVAVYLDYDIESEITFSALGIII